MVEAGAKWTQGDQVGRLCERQNPTKPEIARNEIMKLLGDKGLGPQNVYSPYSLPEGECKVLAEEYIALHEKAYRLNASEEKSKTLERADMLIAAVREGSCVPKAKG